MGKEPVEPDMGKAEPTRAQPKLGASNLPMPLNLPSAHHHHRRQHQFKPLTLPAISLRLASIPIYSLTHEPRTRLHRSFHLPYHPLSRPYSSQAVPDLTLTAYIQTYLCVQSHSIVNLYNNRTNMAAPRTSSFKILRNLQKASSSIPAKRSLHITGVNSSPRPVDLAQKHSYAPLSIQTLRSECSKRSLTPSGTKHELVERLAVHDELQARAFSIAMKRITGEQARKPSR
jgi:hypothetical protein